MNTYNNYRASQKEKRDLFIESQRKQIQEFKEETKKSFIALKRKLKEELNEYDSNKRIKYSDRNSSLSMRRLTEDLQLEPLPPIPAHRRSDMPFESNNPKPLPKPREPCQDVTKMLNKSCYYQNIVSTNKAIQKKIRDGNLNSTFKIAKDYNYDDSDNEKPFYNGIEFGNDLSEIQSNEFLEQHDKIISNEGLLCNNEASNWSEPSEVQVISSSSTNESPLCSPIFLPLTTDAQSKEPQYQNTELPAAQDYSPSTATYQIGSPIYFGTTNADSSDSSVGSSVICLGSNECLFEDIILNEIESFLQNTSVDVTSLFDNSNVSSSASDSSDSVIIL